MSHDRTIAKCLKPIGIGILLAGIAIGSASANNSRPEIDDIIVMSDPTIDTNGDGRADAYGLGSTIEIVVTFDREVAWDTSAVDARGRKAAIKMDLYIGGQVKRISAAVSSDRGTTNTLQFNYVVQEGDLDFDGITIKPFGRDLLLLTRGAKLRGSNGRHALRWCRWCGEAVNLGLLVAAPVQTAEPEPEQASASDPQPVSEPETERDFSQKSVPPVVQDPPGNGPLDGPKDLGPAGNAGRSTVQGNSDPPVFSDPPPARANLISTGTADPSGIPNLTPTNHSTTTKVTKHTSADLKGTTWTWYEWTNALQTILRKGRNLTSEPFAHVNQVLNMNRLGVWGHPFYHDGTHTNRGPDIEVRFRQTGAETNTFPAGFGGPGARGKLLGAAPAIVVLDRWLTYPANPGTNDIRIHVRTKTAAREQINGFNTVTLAEAWGGGSLGIYDWFIAEAYLVAPGTAMQPTAIGGQTSATWAGKVVMVDSNSNRLIGRGTLFGGDASVTVNFATTTADVTLNNFRSACCLCCELPAAQTWSGLAVSNGAFSEETASRKISGAFRQQGSDKNANTVGGVFEVIGSMKGGFVATRN